MHIVVEVQPSEKMETSAYKQTPPGNADVWQVLKLYKRVFKLNFLYDKALKVEGSKVHDQADSWVKEKCYHTKMFYAHEATRANTRNNYTKGVFPCENLWTRAQEVNKRCAQIQNEELSNMQLMQNIIIKTYKHLRTEIKELRYSPQ